MSAGPAKGVAQEHRSSLPKAPLKHQGTDLAPCPCTPSSAQCPRIGRGLQFTPNLAAGWLWPWPVQMLPLCLSFPTWKMGAAEPTPLGRALRAPGWFYSTLGGSQQVFAASPCPGFIWMVILAAQATGPSNPLQGRSPSCCPPWLDAGGGLQLSIPPGPWPTCHTSRGKRGGKHRRLGERHA